MKSVIDGETTMHIGIYFESLSLLEQRDIWRSYYLAGSRRGAVRETTATSSTVSALDSGGQAVTQRY